MSLIADALKKVELPSEDRPHAEPQPPPPEPSPRPDGLYRGLLIVGVGLVLLGIARVTSHPAAPGVKAAAPAARPAPVAVLPKTSPTAPPESAKASGIQIFQVAQAGLVLSGTILDNNGESLALINNEVLREGDQIRNMRVVKVNTDSVDLKDQDGRTKTLGLKN